MVQKIKNQNISHKAFTLIEMMIVLVIIGILLMATLYLSNEQIQKVKDKTIKELIIAEMQSRYSRNIGSSSYAGTMYDTMDITFSAGTDQIDFKYNAKNSGTGIEDVFTNKFEIKYITMNYTGNTDPEYVSGVVLKYSPYQISCEIGGDKDNINVVIVARVNDNRNYCFEIPQKNCRVVEMSESKCNVLNTLLTNKGYSPEPIKVIGTLPIIDKTIRDKTITDKTITDKNVIKNKEIIIK